MKNSKPKESAPKGQTAPTLTLEDYEEVMMLIIQAIVDRIMPEVEEAVREGLVRDGLADTSDDVVRSLAQPQAAELMRLTIKGLETQWSTDPELYNAMLTVTQFFTLALKSMRMTRLPLIKDQDYRWIKILQDAKKRNPDLKGFATVAFTPPDT